MTGSLCHIIYNIYDIRWQRVHHGIVQHLHSTEADALPLPPAMSALQIGILQKRPATALGSDSECTFKRRKTRSGDLHPAQRMQKELLQWMLDELAKIIAPLHYEPAGRPRPIQGNHYRDPKGFADTVITLQKAYAKLLHQTFDNECSSDVSWHSVRSLAGDVTSKLRAHCRDEVQEGENVMRKMLEQCQMKFKWTKIISLLEEAAKEARRKKEECYLSAKSCERELQGIRRHFEA